MLAQAFMHGLSGQQLFVGHHIRPSETAKVATGGCLGLVVQFVQKRGTNVVRFLVPVWPNPHENEADATE